MLEKIQTTLVDKDMDMDSAMEETPSSFVEATSIFNSSFWISLCSTLEPVFCLKEKKEENKPKEKKR